MANPKKLKTNLEDIDAQIRNGHLEQARLALEALPPASLPREQKAKFASMARRISLPYLAMRTLHPLVRAPEGALQPASCEEVCEYAASLTYVGAPGEAIELLGTVEDFPLSQLYLAFAYFSQWDYETALAPLDRYLNSPSLSEYERLVGTVNRIAALIAESREGAGEELDKAIWVGRKLDARYLLGSLYELKGQWAIARQQWNEAQSALGQAEALFQGLTGWYPFFVRKWQTILRIKQGKEQPAAFDKLRTDATELQHWESIRDCDRYQTLADNAFPRALHLYFGTPFPAFRRRLLKELPALAGRLPPHFDWGGETDSPLVWDPLNAPEDRYPTGHVLLSLLQVLQSDFYRPLRTAPLFLKLFPDEHFNPETAPARVHEAVRRLRQWIRKTRKPIELMEADGGYRLVTRKPARLRVYANQPITLSDLRLSKLGQAFATQSFSAKQAASTLGLGTRTINRLMAEWQAAGLVQISGKGKTTRHVLTIK